MAIVRKFLQAFVAVALIATAAALPQQATEQQLTPSVEDAAIRRCNAPSAIEETVQCWMADDDGKWLIGPDVLDAQNALNNADWNQFVETAFRTERNVTKALNRVFQATGGVSSVMLGFALQADEAIYGETAPETRGKMCRALQALVSCVSKHAGARCQDIVNERLDRLPARFGLGVSLPPTAKYDSVLQLGSKILCYICNEADEREGLKVLLGTALDANKRKQTAELMKENNRMQVYQQCPAPQTGASPRTSRDYLQLLQDRPCDFYPYFHCLTNDVHTRVNPGVAFNALDGIGNITFNHLYQCDTAVVPDYGTCKQIADIQAQFKSGGSPSSRNAAGVQAPSADGSPSPNAGVSLMSGSFSVVILVAVAFLSLVL